VLSVALFLLKQKHGSKIKKRYSIIPAFMYIGYNLKSYHADITKIMLQAPVNKTGTSTSRKFDNPFTGLVKIAKNESGICSTEIDVAFESVV
jgi:hypothetical protein